MRERNSNGIRKGREMKRNRGLGNISNIDCICGQVGKEGEDHKVFYISHQEMYVSE